MTKNMKTNHYARAILIVAVLATVAVVLSLFKTEQELAVAVDDKAVKTVKKNTEIAKNSDSAPESKEQTVKQKFVEKSAITQAITSFEQEVPEEIPAPVIINELEASNDSPQSAPELAEETAKPRGTISEYDENSR